MSGASTESSVMPRPTVSGISLPLDPKTASTVAVVPPSYLSRAEYMAPSYRIDEI